MDVDDKNENMRKRAVLKAKIYNHEDQVFNVNDVNSTESITMLVKNFNKVMRILYRRLGKTSLSM